MLNNFRCLPYFEVQLMGSFTLVYQTHYCPLPNKVQGLYISEYVRLSVCPSKGFLIFLLEYDQTEHKSKYMQMCTEQYSSIPKFQREMIEFLLITNDTGTGLSPQFLRFFRGDNFFKCNFPEAGWVNLIKLI